MSELHFSPDKASYEKYELLERYPDIDYEMIPISDDHDYTSGQSNHFYANELQLSEQKEALKKAKSFQIALKSLSEILPMTNTQVFSDCKKKCLIISNEPNMDTLIPLDLIEYCTKTKKYTKIFIKNNLILKTVIPFKKLKRRLLKNGFMEYKKSHLVHNKLRFHFPKESTK